MSNVDYKKIPIVIGGTGGSGTRIVTLLLMNAGIFMGTNLGHALDARELISFYKQWINLYWNKDIILTRKQNRKILKIIT